MAERFEEYLGAQAEAPDTILTWKFCKTLIQEGKNTYDNLLAIGRYGLFIKNNAIYVAILEVLDGAEVQPNLYQKVGTLFGERVRDEVFAGIGVSPMGLPPAEKPFDMFPVLDRLISKLGYEQVEILLSACLRDLPEEYYLDDREKFFQLANIDEYLRYKHQSLVKRLETCQQEGKLFFSQEINDDVVQYVREHPETESGVRQGNVLFISKIPYDTIRFLGESNLTLKRYYACHCPWVRHAIKQGNIKLNPVFCNCSGGFSKRPWEVIFGQSLKMEVLESVLLGDLRCRFAVYLPEKSESIQVT
jgi:hypothetical protein